MTPMSVLKKSRMKKICHSRKFNFDFGSLAVNNPERMAMAGTSGSGKTESTLFYIIPKMVEKLKNRDIG